MRSPLLEQKITHMYIHMKVFEHVYDHTNGRVEQKVQHKLTDTIKYGIYALCDTSAAHKNSLPPPINRKYVNSKYKSTKTNRVPVLA